jgi:ankyrin repeat protein
MEALMQAVGKGEEGTIVRLLDEDPALLERVDKDGHRPLTRAAAHGRLQVVKLLLQRGAEADARGRLGGTALYWAAKGGWVEIAICLLSHGADAKARDTYGKIPLIVACGKGHLGVVRVLLQHMGEVVLQATDDRGTTALHWAAKGGWVEMATFLLSNGADATRRDMSGNIPLLVACSEGHLGVVRVLLQPTGAHGLEATDNCGRTALHLAAKGGNKDVVACLLTAGAHADSRTDWDRTPLMSACWHGHVGVVRVLLQHTGGQGLEATDDCGKTALHLAAMKGQEETTAFLLGQGANINAVADMKRTPLMLACMESHVGVARVLLQHMGEKGLQATDWERKTALHLAAKKGHGEIVRLLLFAGADHAVKDEKRNTPRALAAYWGKAECVAIFKVRPHPHTCQTHTTTSHFL